MALGARPQIISLSPKRLADIWEDFRTRRPRPGASRNPAGKFFGRS